MRSFLLVVHIVAAGAWIGGNVTQLVVMPRLTKAGGELAASWMRTTVTMGRLLYTPAAIVALASGVGLVLNSSLYDFENLFVVIGFLVIIAGGALGMRFFGPKGEKAALAYEAGDTSEANATVSRITSIVILDTALVVFAVASMVTRWGV